MDVNTGIAITIGLIITGGVIYLLYKDRAAGADEPYDEPDPEPEPEPDPGPEPEPALLDRHTYYYKLIDSNYKATGTLPSGEAFGYRDIIAGVKNKVALNVSQRTCPVDRKFDIVTEVTFPDGSKQLFNASRNVKANFSAGGNIADLGIATEGVYSFYVQLFDHETGIKLHEMNYSTTCTMRY